MMSNYTYSNETTMISGDEDNVASIANSHEFEINEILLPKIVAMFSMVGSSIIIAEVLKEWKQQRRAGDGKSISAVSKTLLYMSISDFLFSLYVWTIFTPCTCLYCPGRFAHNPFFSPQSSAFFLEHGS